jgi:hypothetical protein
VLRPTSLPHARLALVAGLLMVAGLLVPGASYAATGEATTPSAAAAASVETTQPLVPRIRSITPDYVPDHGPIVIRGVLTNASDQTWSAINVHAFMGDSPITSTSDLAAAAALPVDAYVGARITVPGTFASISSLLPGETASFEIRLPHHVLPVSGPGVYWFGVHVLGDNGDGGARVAVGRDRTFLSYVPATEQQGLPEDTALVVPVRAGVVRGPDGTVTDPEAWGRSLSSGPLHDLLTLGRAAQSRPLTWLLDPAVLDVVRQLAKGNPPRTLGPATPATDGADGGDDTADGSSAADSTGSASGAANTVPASATRKLARHWLRQLHRQLGRGTGEVLGLPYGDLDVESALRTGEGSALLQQAFHRTRQSLRRWQLPATSVVSPPSGRTTPEAMRELPRSTDVLLDDLGVTDSDTTVSRAAGHRVVLASSGAAAGGPGPVAAHSPIALRQRILAEAALRLLDDHQPLVVELPDTLQRRLGRSFFDELDVPWVRLTTLSGATSLASVPSASQSLRPLPAGKRRLPDAIYGAADSLLDEGRTLQSVLIDNHVLARQLFDEVTGNASYTAAQEPYLALSRTRIVGSWVSKSLDAIDLAAPPSVTLAGTSGRFSTLVSNQLDVPVRVRVRASSDSRLRISGGDSVRLAPHGQTTVSLNASTHQRGVHNVTLQLSSRDGRLLPHTSDSFPMRSEQVSGLIWVIIGVGVGLLFAAIVIRLTRRVLRERVRRRTARAG